MPLVIVGVLLLLARWAELGPLANMSWWWTLVPFIAAALWWEFADSSGITQRRVVDKLERRKADRREQQLESLGLGTRRGRGRAAKDARAQSTARQRARNMAESGERDMSRRSGTGEDTR